MSDLKLYAVTYTDSCEPWGADVCDGKLYATREAAEAALEAEFQQHQKDTRGRWSREDFDREYAIGEYTVEGLTDSDRGRLQGTV
jgi:hypothetical protein